MISLGENAFYNCTGLSEASIGKSVNSIGDYTFAYCAGLTSIDIPNSVTTIGDYAFYSCTGLRSVSIGSSVRSIGKAFDGCYHIDKVTLYSQELCNNTNEFDNNRRIRNYFYYASEYIIGENIEKIENGVFMGNSLIKKISILNPNTYISSKAFKDCNYLERIYTNKGGIALLNIWNMGLDAYDLKTMRKIERPSLSYQLTQTTATVSINDFYDEYKYQVYFEKNPYDYYEDENKPEGIDFADSEFTWLIKGLKPAAQYSCWLVINEYACSEQSNFTTEGLNPQVKIVKKTPTALVLQGVYTQGDAVFKDHRISFENEQASGNTFQKDKLEPYKGYLVEYEVDVVWGENNENTATYSWGGYIYTEDVNFNVLEPKVISVGNVIVASTVNIEDDDAVVGFEWRRLDWTDEIASSTGGAVLFEGTMEGYIRNMNANYLWKVRPYYQSYGGKRSYGKWVGFDPSNTSYFEPTVHTYSKVVVSGNTALLKGYVMRGTDKVETQGFKYWKISSNPSGIKDNDIPDDAIIVKASGQIMTATLTNLEDNSEYGCVAFVTTSEGETFYGEKQIFHIGEATGIGNVIIDKDDTKASENKSSVIGYYNLQGQRVTEPQRGLNIIRYSNGTSKKVLVK